jgi:ribonuclease HII
MTPTLDHEHALHQRGYRRIAGVDEAGRGCLAGPVVAAAVVLRPDVYDASDDLEGIDDSKRLSPVQRAELVPRVRRVAAALGVGMVPAFVVDQFGIVRATRLAMELAVLNLDLVPDALLIDALRLPTLALHQEALIYGDSVSYSIAAASIIAKTARDQRMTTLDRAFPAYGFAAHKGYGTAQHLAAIHHAGPCDEHRMSFRPLWMEDDP